MCLPIFLYLAREEPRRWLRLGLMATFFLSIVAVPFTFSRGGVLGLGAVLSVLLYNSRRRYLMLPIALIAAYSFIVFAPRAVIERMETVRTYEQDGSAMGRLRAWSMGVKIANDRPLVGGGFEVFKNVGTWTRYEPEFQRTGSGLDAHSIYFNMLGEHGYVGLGLFLALILSSLSTLRKLKKLGQRDDVQWVANYACMLEASIAGYLVAGAFVSKSYLDFAYHIFVLVVILKYLAEQELQGHAVRPVPTSADRRGVHSNGRRTPLVDRRVVGAAQGQGVTRRIA
jgi:probable O-glycosylation ligase (exosortase A-associated)